MLKRAESYLTEITATVIFFIIGYLFYMSLKMSGKTFSIPDSILIYNTVFVSILIEALPFVLIGVFVSGAIQVFITEDHIRRLIPKNPFLAVTSSCVIGVMFPACECGIVPIVRRLVAKGVPIYAGVGFLLTSPLINPVVIGSTYMAFGNDGKIALLRMLIGFIVAMIVAIVISFFFKHGQVRKKVTDIPVSKEMNRAPLTNRIKEACRHSIDEFFGVAKFLVMGALLAAFVQTYVSTGSLLGITEDLVTSTLIMMGLAYVLSLCSEADAFIAASFRHLFPTTTPILAFLVYGPMLDLKNTFMLMGAFKFRFVITLMFLITVTVFAIVLLIA